MGVPVATPALIMSGSSEGHCMHSVKSITMTKWPPKEPATYNANVGQSGMLTFIIDMPWVQEDAVKAGKPFDPYVADRRDFTTPFDAYSLSEDERWFEINDTPSCVFKNGIAVQEITITPREDVQPGQYKVNIGRILHGWQAGAGDIMYTIRRRHRYAIVVVAVEE